MRVAIVRRARPSITDSSVGSVAIGIPGSWSSEAELGDVFSGGRDRRSGCHVGGGG